MEKLNLRKAVVVIPTYNEADNIGRLVPLILARDARLSVLVVDDNSPDGTANIVKGLPHGFGERQNVGRDGQQLGKQLVVVHFRPAEQDQSAR